jgi:hypothetical protein
MIRSDDRGGADMKLVSALAISILIAVAHAWADGTTGSMPGDHMHHAAAAGATGTLPTLPGQDAFGAVQEIVRILEADPNTDWSKVDLDALREHLIDMNEVTLHADARVTRIEGGISVAVTGSGRTLQAIQRMVPAQARQLDGQNGWRSRADMRPDGVLLVVASTDPKQAAMIQGLGFIGVMATGSHHQMHHLAIAKGEGIH